MTTQKKSLPSSFVPLLVLISALAILVGCGGGGGVGPSPTPTPAPTPPVAILLGTSNFSTQVGSVGFATVNPRAGGAGVLKFIAKWTPGPPNGQIFLFVVRDGVNDPQACFNNFNCPQILAKDIGQGTPKQVEFRIVADERIYFWVRPVTGAVTGTVEIWFTPN